MTTLELLQKEYKDLVSSSLLGDGTGTNLALAKALQTEIKFWQSRINAQEFEIEKNVINLKIAKNKLMSLIKVTK